MHLTTLASTILEIFKGVYNLKVGHMTLTTPLSVFVCYRQAGTCYDKSTIKFEVSNFTRSGNMKGVAKCRKCGGLGWLGVTQGH